MEHSLNEHAAQSQSTELAERPRWVAFGVTLAMILALVVIPYVAGAAVTPLPQGTIGVYERITLQGESETGSVLGGFIAPHGWMEAESEDAAETSARSFYTPNGDVTVRVSVLALAETAEELLKLEAPVGADLTPIVRLESAPLLTADLLEYDLEAGDGVSQRIAVCEVLKNSACLLFEVEMRAPLSGVERGQLLPDVAAMVASAEVLPNAKAQA